MKKIIKLPDGSEETFEGTPEELAQYEKQLREGGPRPLPTGKRILNEDVKVATDDVETCECKLCEVTRGFMKDFKKSPQIVPNTEYWPPIDTQPYQPYNPWTNPNPWDRAVEPFTPNRWPEYFKVYWTTSDRVTLKCGN